MTRIIAIANQKGGVGKTTTTISLGVALSRESKRVLLVDLDPQAALSVSLGLAVAQLRETVYRVLLSEVPIEQAIRGTHSGPDILPANIDLSAAELELAAQMGRERFLAEALQPVAGKYDFILLDLPPSLGLLTVNALVAANEVIIPVQCEYLAVRALTLLLVDDRQGEGEAQPVARRRRHPADDVQRPHAALTGSPRRDPHDVSRPRLPDGREAQRALQGGARRRPFDHRLRPEQDGAQAYTALAKELLQ